jgi:hypothetical protein
VNPESTSDTQLHSPRRIITRLAWVVWALSLTLTGVGLWLLALTYTTDIGPRWGFRGVETTLAVTFSTVGALIASRHPRNLIGWFFCWVGLASGIAGFAEGYAVYALLTRPGALPAGEVMAWLRNWIWVTYAVPALTFLPLLFPEGRLPSPRWQPVVWLVVGNMAAMTFGVAFRPGQLKNFYYLNNPFGIEGAGDILEVVFGIAMMILSATAFAAAASLILRLRRSTGGERQQLKWVAYAAALWAFVSPAGSTVPTVGPLLFIAGMLGLPISVGIAILRYRLYDIDILIRRTLIYSVLTGTLALVYFGGVILLQGVFRALTGQTSELAIIVSTLTIAGLFAPLRRRIQDVIDRRFYRRKYDAEQVLAAFAETCRDETDLGG